MDLINDGKRLYFNDENGQLAGEVSYFKLPHKDVEVLERVFVSLAFRGQGVVEDITREFMNFIQENNEQLYPLCPYAKRFLAKNPEFEKYNVQSSVSEADVCTVQNNIKGE